MDRSPDNGGFRGFRRPYYTVVPDDVFDNLLPDLSGAEIKVLLYVVRRTFGFKKDSDTISLQQICKGITTKDGRQLDRGTGLNKDTAVRAVKGLVERNIIRTERRSTPKEGDQPTLYSLVFEDDPVSDNPTRGVGKDPLPRVGLSDTQETVLQETVEQETVLSNIRLAPATQNGAVD